MTFVCSDASFAPLGHRNIREHCLGLNRAPSRDAMPIPIIIGLGDGVDVDVRPVLQELASTPLMSTWSPVSRTSFPFMTSSLGRVSAPDVRRAACHSTT
jgi:hypothetical protein